MDFIIMLLLLIISQYAIGNYFAAKGYQVIKEFDFYKDKEILDEIGIAAEENMVEDLEDKKEQKFLIFELLTGAFVIIVVTILICVIFLEFSSIEKTLIGAVVIFSLALLVILDKWLTLKEIIKLKDNDYRVAFEEEHKRLVPIRIFYIISSIIVIIGVLIIQDIYNLKELSEPYYNISFSVILIYLGGMGLISKIMFLKIPVKLDGKLQPYINTIVLLIGLYLLISSLYRILFIMG